jgi:tRNA A-37 threonylcarbamoyl transferase component Bud32
MSDISSLATSLADRYTIQRELGQGGMATVYLAHDLRHDRKVAIKVLRPELSAILGAERFLKEIRLTANLQHPHILPLHDSGTADGTVFYVMPYVEGESLRHRILRDKQLPVEDAIRIAREVASALDYAHRHGVVHRDIKPENILLHDGQALVADFGIALAVSTAGGSTRITETGMSLGTPHYMSPEQAMGEREITARSDVYALGCVLYEMLLGEPPFTGPTAQAIIARVVTEEPRPMRVQRRSIPPNVEAAVHTALSKLPADRFSSATQFSEALGKAEFTAASSTLVTTPSARRGLALRLFAIAPWLLLLAAVGIAAWGWLRSPVPQVSRQHIVLTPAPMPVGALGVNVALSPDGRTIAFVDSVGGTTQIMLKDRHQLEAVPITGTAGAAGPVFSPDGEWIAFVVENKLKKVPRLGGSPITIADSANSFIPAAAWLEDGTIVFNTDDFHLQAVNQDGGPQRRLVSSDSISRGVVSVTALPKGRGVLFGVCTFGCPEADLRAIDIRSGRTIVLVEDVLKGWHTADGHVVFVRRDGGVLAAPFDAGKLAFRTAPVPVLEGVRTVMPYADMALSPAGTLLYVAGTAQVGAVVEAVSVNRRGEAQPLEADWAFNPTGNWGMALSPDGRRLALGIRTGSSQDIWIKELGGGPLTRLTFDGDNVRPWWTQDGTSVMYVSTKDGGNADIRMRRADGTGEESTLLDLRRPIFDIGLTGDRQAIVRFGQGPTRDIGLVRPGDTAWTPLLSSDRFDEAAPVLSPDGRWLAYASNESGRMEIYARPFPSVDAGRWQISRAGGTEPLWARNGRELFFRSAGGDLMSVAVGVGPGFSASEPRALFQASDYVASEPYRTYDISPDGERFIFVRFVGRESDAQQQTPIVQIENWLEELRATRTRR